MLEEFNIETLDEILNYFKNIKINKREDCIFDSISNTYYLENYHSDILAYYLSYDLVKKKLIEWINRCFANKESKPVSVEYERYEGGPKPEREKEDRDITLYSKDRKHAIIIENKSNGAGDRSYQIPRYYEVLRAEGYIVDAIIYLNKRSTNYPGDYHKWNIQSFKENLKDKVPKYEELDDETASSHLEDLKKKLVCASINRKNGFSQNVIDNVMRESNDIRLSGLSSEIKILFGNIVKGISWMDNDEVQKIITGLVNEDRVESFKKTKKFYDDFPLIICEYYKDYAESLISKEDDRIDCKLHVHDALFWIEGTLSNEKRYAVNFDFRYIYDENISYQMINQLFSRDAVNDDDLAKDLESFRALAGNDFNLKDYNWYCVGDIFKEDDIKKRIREVVDFFRNHKSDSVM